MYLHQRRVISTDGPSNFEAKATTRLLWITKILGRMISINGDK